MQALDGLWQGLALVPGSCPRPRCRPARRRADTLPASNAAGVVRLRVRLYGIGPMLQRRLLVPGTRVPRLRWTRSPRTNRTNRTASSRSPRAGRRPLLPVRPRSRRHDSWRVAAPSPDATPAAPGCPFRLRVRPGSGGTKGRGTGTPGMAPGARPRPGHLAPPHARFPRRAAAWRRVGQTVRAAAPASGAVSHPIERRRNAMPSAEKVATSALSLP